LLYFLRLVIITQTHIKYPHMKRILLSTQQSVPTLMIALSDKLTAELIASLESKKLFKVVNIMTDGESLFETLESQKPDYLLIDTELPNGGSFGFLKKLERIKPSTKVIVYSKITNPDFLKVFLSSPALGYIQQGCGLKDFISSLKSVFQGKRLVFSQTRNFNQPDENYKKSLYDLSLLTEREMDVWELLLKSYTEKEIATELSISTSTVRSHKNKISDKFEIKGKIKITQVATTGKGFSPISNYV
jgi:two-component system, NarL family, response regulator FusR